jgi:hypothetical protein
VLEFVVLLRRTVNREVTVISSIGASSVEALSLNWLDGGAPAVDALEMAFASRSTSISTQIGRMADITGNLSLGERGRSEALHGRTACTNGALNACTA